VQATATDCLLITAVSAATGIWLQSRHQPGCAPELPFISTNASTFIPPGPWAADMVSIRCGCCYQSRGGFGTQVCDVQAQSWQAGAYAWR